MRGQQLACSKLDTRRVQRGADPCYEVQHLVRGVKLSEIPRAPQHPDSQNTQWAEAVDQTHLLRYHQGPRLQRDSESRLTKESKHLERYAVVKLRYVTDF